MPLFHYSGDLSNSSLFLSDTDVQHDVYESMSVDVTKVENDLDTAMKNLMDYFTKYKLSFGCLENTAKLMNSMPGAKVQLPVTKYKLLKEFMNSVSFDLQYNIYCKRCQVYTMCDDRKDQIQCGNCSTTLKLREMNHFVYIPVANQLKQMLSKYWEEIKKFKASLQCHDDQRNLKDVHSGEILMKVNLKGQNTLSLMINTDGASLQKSNKASFLPLQIICNFLPPSLRYRKENIIVAAFSYAHTKTDMCEFFKPFAEEMAELSTKGFLMNDEYFQPIVTHAVFDLPARASFQRIKQYNGYYACGYCLHPGEATSVGTRYTYRAEKIEMRTHEGMIKALNNVNRHRNDVNFTDNGVYGISPAIAFEHFDLVDSMGIDYMHCVTIGVMKKFFDFWWNTPDHGSYLCKEKKHLLNKRICAIKPCRYVSRLPRSLELRKMFKASEYRSLLIYNLPVALIGILKKEYVDHFNLLSSSIYILLKNNISVEELNIAGEKLKMFVQQYEELYGKNHMTMNVHLLLHFTSSVKCLGPLWTTSMFSFESNNVTFGECLKGNTDVLSQITTKYAIAKSVARNKLCHKTPEDSEIVQVPKLLQLGSKDIQTLRTHNISFDRSNVKVFCVLKKNLEIYTSICYNRSKKTIDYFVVLKTKLIGKIKFYIKYGKKIYFIIEEFEFVRHLHHITKIKPKQIDSIHVTDEIEKKLMYINFGDRHFITDRPNHFEGD